jgi:hypothetical protein
MSLRPNIFLKTIYCPSEEEVLQQQCVEHHIPGHEAVNSVRNLSAFMRKFGFFYSEDKGSMVLRNICIYVPNHTVSYP